MRRAASVLLLLLMGAAAALLVSGRLYVVRSSSMMPAIRAGDAILVRSLDRPPEVDEIVVYEVQGQLVTHRVVDVGPDGVVTKGDANEEPDPWLVDRSQVLGRVVLRLPFVGWFLAFLRQPVGWFLLVMVPAVAFVAVYGLRTVRAYRDWRAGTRPAGGSAAVPRFAGDAFAYLPARDRRWRSRPQVRALLAILLVVAIGTAARGGLAFFSATRSQALTIATAVSTAPALVDIKPETLQLGSHGDHVTAFIRLLDADVGGIDVSSVRLCVGISPCGTGGVSAADPMWTHGGQALKVRFARESVIALLSGVTPPADVVLTVSGLVDGRPFAGSDVVRVIGCGSGGPGPGPNADPTPLPTPSPSEEPSPSVEPTPSASPAG